MIHKLTGLILFAILLGFFVSLFVGTVVWLLWGLVMPQVFGLPDITWLQAIALSWICAMLFKVSVSQSKEKE